MNAAAMPAWAESQLRGTQHVAVEHQLLRQFFNAWKDMHSIPNDKLHRNKSERAAQNLVDIAHQIELLIDPVQIKRTSVHG